MSDYLHQILDELKIGNRSELDQWIQANQAPLTNSESSPLKIIGRKDLRIDDENRIYTDDLKISHSILRVDQLCIRNSSKITIKNSIICGDLSIGQSENKPTDIILDFCIVLGRVRIYGLCDTEASISATRVNCVEFELQNVKLSEVSFNSCHILRLSLHDAQLAELNTFENRFEFLDVKSTSVNESYFDFKQITPRNLGLLCDDERLKKELKGFNPFDYPQNYNLSDRDALNNIESLNFLMNHSTLKEDREPYNRVRYLETLETQRNKAAKCFMTAIGGFSNPCRILLIGVISLTVFSLCYMLPYTSFKVGDENLNGLSLLESLYFSGITFTTIGYGDFAPMGWTRFLAVTEGFTGVLLISAFLASLIRKYCD